MPDQPVKETLPQSPFHFAGRLDLSTGEEIFTELSSHEVLKNNIITRSSQPISIWSLVGPIGIGRTWTMAWLGRQARYHDMCQDDTRWEVALVPGLGGGGNIRSIFESIFSSTEYLRDEVREKVEEDQEFGAMLNSNDVTERILQRGLRDRSTWSVFTGNRGRFPSMEGIDQKPKWTDREVQLRFLSEWFKGLADIGVDNVLVLIDEFEILATRLSKNKLIELSDGLRSFFDAIENESENTPNIQVVLSLTTEGATNIDPSVGTEGAAGWVRPLQDRMNPPFFLEKIDQEEALEIAQNGLEAKRTIEVDEPYNPYTEDAVVRAFQASGGLPRRFAKILNQMHQSGYSNNELDIDIAEKAIEALGLDTEEIR